MSTRRWRPRAAALLAGGAFALHQLRYLLGYGSRSHHALAAQGHAYLTVVAPLVAAVLLLAAADVLVRVTAARPGDAAAPAPSFRRLWALAAGFLFAAYCVQESLEGLLSTGHPSGLAGVLGHGGCYAGPLAIAIGLVAALLLRGADRAVALAGEPRVRVAPPRPPLALAFLSSSRQNASHRLVRPQGARAPPASSIG